MQSKIIAASLKISAIRRYFLHSGSRALPSRWAKRIVAIRPADSWRTFRITAPVAEAVESPTPRPKWGLDCVDGDLEKGLMLQTSLEDG